MATEGNGGTTDLGHVQGQRAKTSTPRRASDLVGKFLVRTNSSMRFRGHTKMMALVEAALA